MRKKKDYQNNSVSSKTSNHKILKLSLVIVFVVILQISYIIYESKCTEPGFPLDDPWIHMQFAKNIANGNGFSYNPDQLVAGSTAPLWTIMLVPVHWFVPTIPSRVIFTKILGIFIFVVCLVLVFFFAFEITKDSYPALFATFAVGTNAHLNWGAISGLEIPLYVMLTILILYLNHKSINNAKVSRRYILSVLLGLSIYARPECGLLFLFYLIDNFLFLKRPKKEAVSTVLIFSAILILYFIFNYTLSGSIFPNTFRVKAQANSLITALLTMNTRHLMWLIFKMTPAYFGQFLAHLFKANPLFVIGAFIGAIIIISRRLQFKTDRPSMMLVFTSFLYAPLIGLISPFISADFHEGRYIANQIASASLLSVLGFYWLFQMLKKQMAKKPLNIMLGILCGIFLYNTIVAQVFMIKFYASNVKSINEIQVKAGKWIKKYTPHDAIIAVNDVGAIAYFSNRNIIDLCGLVTPEIINYFNRYKNNKIGAYYYVLEKKPDYLVIFPRWFPGLTDTNQFQILHRIRYDKNTASEWVFIPDVESYFGIILKKLKVKPLSSEKWILKFKKS
uniref:Glycosyltransferase RgtA/B/C/D-like domain-containing protein n=1 Tax=candidate division WOR-3 bacterium TaxID=2052148 RepID=A0A7V3RH32_UNCW3